MDKTSRENPNVERYPVRALEEALGNVLAHRDYTLHDPTRVTVFADRVELLSPGALPLGVTLARLARSGQLRRGAMDETRATPSSARRRGRASCSRTTSASSSRGDRRGRRAATTGRGR